jgi:hypothetical protein
MREPYAAGLPVQDKKAQEQEAREAEGDNNTGSRKRRQRGEKRDRLRMNKFVCPGSATRRRRASASWDYR